MLNAAPPKNETYASRMDLLGVVVGGLIAAISGWGSAWFTADRAIQLERHKVEFEQKTKFCFDLVATVSEIAEKSARMNTAYRSISDSVAGAKDKRGSLVDPLYAMRDTQISKLRIFLHGPVEMFGDTALKKSVELYEGITQSPAEQSPEYPPPNNDYAAKKFIVASKDVNRDCAAFLVKSRPKN